MLQAIADQQIRHLQLQIVNRDLIECFLGNFDSWRFVLHYHQRLQVCIVNNGIAAFRQAVERDGGFVADACGRHMQRRHQVRHHILTHPLFGRQRNIPTTHGIENLPFSAI